MMNTTLREAGWFAGIAVSVAAAGVCVSAMAWAAPGGTIYFQGMLLAPSYSISAMSGRAGSKGTNFETEGMTGTDGQMTVSFVAPPANPPSAHVSALNATNVSLLDGHGKRIAHDANGAYRVGAAGGVLSIKSEKAATIVTTYD
jgi:type 1 fimbria pilin